LPQLCCASDIGPSGLSQHMEGRTGSQQWRDAEMATLDDVEPEVVRWQPRQIDPDRLEAHLRLLEVGLRG
jgi:hypothetical protein